MKTIRKTKTNFKPQPGANRVSRYKIGSAPKQNFTPKETSPGVLSIPIGKAQPSRPQNKERMGVGGRKGKAKGRTDPKAANPRDPGATPMPSTKVHWPTNDKNAQKGYIKGRGWPLKDKTVQGAGPSPYRVAGEGGYTDDGANAQDMDGSY